MTVSIKVAQYIEHPVIIVVDISVTASM
jgi:hypothetical protein